MIDRDIAIGPVTGWRVWKPVMFNDGSAFVPRLISNGNTVWPTDDWLKAKCLESKDHVGPQLFCTCGIYARKDVESLERGFFYGEVELAGLVVEGESGYVASYAFPKRLYIRQTNCEGVKATPDDALTRFVTAATFSSFLSAGLSPAPTCTCIGQPDTDLIEAIGLEYGIEVVHTEDQIKCNCTKHCKKEKKDEHRRTEKSDRDTSSETWPPGFSTLSSFTTISTQTPRARKSWFRKLIP